MAEPPFEVSRAQRWFAVECNNLGWEIIEGGERTPEAIERLLHLAHAACLHWGAVGTQLNRQRALDLLARAYLAAERNEQALQYARQAIELSEWNAAEQTPFDRAEALGTMAVCFKATGDAEGAAQWRAQALAAAQELDAEEREIVVKLLD